MSHVEIGNGRFRWMAAVAGTSIRKSAGCLQCGSGLELSALDNHSGKCFNCQMVSFEEDEALDDLED